MEAVIWQSFFFMISFLALYAGVLLYKKKEEAEIIQALVMDFLAIICWGAMWAGIFSIAGIPVNIVSIGIVYLLSSAYFWISIIRNKKVQKYIWSWMDIVIVLVIAGIVMGVAIHFFSGRLELRYWTSDAAVHMISATDVVRKQTVSSMYFAPLYNALIMEVFQPWFHGIEIYKGFMIADITMIVLENIIFYVLVKPYFTKKSHKIMGAVLTLLYFAGYPLHGFIYTFNYWGIGVLLLAFVMEVLRQYFSKELEKKYCVFALMLGCIGVVTSYMMFAPVAFIAVFLCLVYYAKKEEGKIFSIPNVMLALKVFLVPCMLALYFCYYQFFVGQELEIGTALNEQGAIYRQLYMDFVWMIPLVLYVLIYAIKQKKWKVSLIFFFCYAVFTLAVLVLSQKQKISSYYYYKMYFPLWLLCFVISAQGIIQILQKEKEFFYSCAALYAGILLLNVTNVEQKIVESPAVLQLENASARVFPLYSENLRYIRLDWSVYQFNQNILELYQYVDDNMSEESKDIPLLVAGDAYPYCYWYMAFTGQDVHEYYGWVYDISEMKEKIAQGKMDYVVLLYRSTYYSGNQEYWDTYEKVYNNAEGCILKVSSEETE